MSSTSPDDTNDIVDLFADYADSFNDFDAEGVADLFAYPTTIWQLGQGHVFNDSEELVENVEALLKAFDEAGVTYTEPEVGPVQVSGASAFATVYWRQQDEAGDILHAFQCDYLIVKDHGDWVIATVVNKEPVDEVVSNELN